MIMIGGIVVPFVAIVSSIVIDFQSSAVAVYNYNILIINILNIRIILTSFTYAGTIISSPGATPTWNPASSKFKISSAFISCSSHQFVNPFVGFQLLWLCVRQCSRLCSAQNWWANCKAHYNSAFVLYIWDEFPTAFLIIIDIINSHQSL